MDQIRSIQLILREVKEWETRPGLLSVQPWASQNILHQDHQSTTTSAHWPVHASEVRSMESRTKPCATRTCSSGSVDERAVGGYPKEGLN